VIDQLKTQTPRYVAVAALVLTGLAFVLGGVSLGVGAAIGGTLAVLDAWAITWLASRIVSGAGFIDRGARWGVDPLGFSVGLGALVLGMLYSGAELSIREAQTAREAQGAGEG
jgi:hypothetical protein